MVAKYGAERLALPAVWVTGARFITGLLFTAPAILRRPSMLRPRAPRWVYLRALTNVAAVILFFTGIQATAVSRANLLNMTYPLFVFVFAPLVTRERTRPVLYVWLAVALIGVWNVIRPDATGMSAGTLNGDLLAAGSALVAGFSIASLRRARRTDGSSTIMFYVMALGVLVHLFILPFVPVPGLPGLLVALAAGILGALGQQALTVGFSGVSAPAGALLSTARIPIAGIGGVLLFGDYLGLRTIAGAVLVVGALAGAAWTPAESSRARPG